MKTIMELETKWFWKMNYCKKHGITPAQNEVWDYVEKMWEDYQSPNYITNKNMKNKTSPTKPKNYNKKTWVETQAEYKQKEFDEKAKELIWQLTEGGGSKSLYVLESLRSLEWSYLACAAYRMAEKGEKHQKI